MADKNKTYYHGYITIPKSDGIDYLIPTTTINDVLTDNKGTTLNTVIQDIRNDITQAANVDPMTNSDIDEAFTAAGIK